MWVGADRLGLDRAADRAVHGRARARRPVDGVDRLDDRAAVHRRARAGSCSARRSARCSSWAARSCSRPSCCFSCAASSRARPRERARSRAARSASRRARRRRRATTRCRRRSPRSGRSVRPAARRALRRHPVEPGQRRDRPQRQLSHGSSTRASITPDRPSAARRAPPVTSRPPRAARPRSPSRAGDRVVGAAAPRSAMSSIQAREVARVDQLQRRVRRAGREHLAALGEPPQPPRQPADVLVRPDDHARAREPARGRASRPRRRARTPP